ncbi:MAG TPA: PQQ-binding-like beta-propeller repeat protein [Pirellulales bacterium]|nr:PQQ-binding-like beta-propeller repeat protein [Pirellulales bacterium]
MLARRVFAIWLGGILAWQTVAHAQSLVPETTLARHGLTRAWRAQIDLNRSIDRIAYITQFDGALYVQTKHGMVHALDAETGKKLWSAQIGKTSQIAFAPGVNSQYLAVINGTTLHVLDRVSGRQKFERVLKGSPGTGPVLSDTMVFVCRVSGLVEGFDLEDQHALPWVYQAAGRISTQPVLSSGSLAWTTDRGFFYVGDADPPKVRLRVETGAEIASRPADWAPFIYACSLSGFVYALNEETGQTPWKFPAGSTISKQPAAINGEVFVVRDAGGMFALDGHTGDRRWFAPNITQFCALSASRVYAIDSLDRLAILDSQRGTLLATMPLGDVQRKLINQQTDRIYLASDSGVLQCLRELSQAKPIVYIPPRLNRESGKSEKKKREEAKNEKEAPKEEAEAPAAENMPEEEKPADGAEENEEEAMPDEKKDGEEKNPFN